ncbi:methyltransferase domain-containing protein [Methylobacillus sp.]|uniref:methyltransferase domain-containing protein n=1 Tax=Methylobacillus sp. TaxID=56818 RepID=UPI002FE0CC7A
MIVCLPDLLRDTTAFPHGFFDLVREPILQGCGLDIAYPPDSRQPSNLIPGFELETFYRLINNSNERPAWEPYFHAIPEAAAAYLQQHIPPGSLVLSFEMPPWLAQLCNSAGIDFIDIRPSPLRFGRDLYIALRTNNLSLYQHISSHHVLPEELRLEAAELAASMRMHQQRLEESNRYPFDLDGSLIFIGQAPYDASLLGPGKANPLNCSDFANQLRQLAHGRRVLHKPHPFAVDHAQLEQDMLQHILQTEVRPCRQNAYQILSCHHDVVLAGISSGMLQEAAWFGKPAHILFQPFTPLADSAEPDLNAYQQVHFDTWLSPGFWHAVFTPEQPAPRIARLPPRQHHHARHLLDQWWDYAKVMTWEKSLPIESFERSGGIVLRQRIEALEHASLQSGGLTLDCDEGNSLQWPPGSNIRGKISIRGQGNRITIAEGADINVLVSITGDNNVIQIDPHVRLAGKIYFWGSGGSLQIGRNSTFARADFKCHEGRSIIIGKDAMFSYDVELRTTDGHSIVDPDNGCRLNLPEDILIGDHVWVGKGAFFLKGAQVANNSIVGAHTLVNRAFLQEQIILAGNPAKIIKEGITWHRDAKDVFTQAELDTWKHLSSARNIKAQSLDDASATRWSQCLDDIQQKIQAHPQQFGRGALYQGHETWGVPGQRPTLQRIGEYQLERWLLAQTRVLDIGCNIGMFGLALSSRIKHYRGFDNNPLLIDIARQMANVRQIDNCLFTCESFQEFIARNQGARFDTVLSFAVHVWIDMPLADYARTLHALLEPGGILVWESNRLDTNDPDFFQNVRHFIDAGFSIRFCGRVKDDGIIERGFYILAKDG